MDASGQIKRAISKKNDSRNYNSLISKLNTLITRGTNTESTNDYLQTNTNENDSTEPPNVWLEEQISNELIHLKESVNKLEKQF